MITAKEARNNMKYSLNGILEELNTHIILRSRENFNSVVIYSLPAGLFDEVVNVLVSNGFEVMKDGAGTLEISW